MKDARGHGSNPKGALDQAMKNAWAVAAAPHTTPLDLRRASANVAAHQAAVQQVGKNPAFTQKHFEMIAGVLANHAATVRGSPIAHDALVAQFADKLSKTNPKFDKARFTKAAGGHYP